MSNVIFVMVALAACSAFDHPVLWHGSLMLFTVAVIADVISPIVSSITRQVNVSIKGKDKYL